MGAVDTNRRKTRGQRENERESERERERERHSLYWKVTKIVQP